MPESAFDRFDNQVLTARLIRTFLYMKSAHNADGVNLAVKTGMEASYDELRSNPFVRDRYDMLWDASQRQRTDQGWFLHRGVVESLSIFSEIGRKHDLSDETERHLQYGTFADGTYQTPLVRDPKWSMEREKLLQENIVPSDDRVLYKLAVDTWHDGCHVDPHFSVSADFSFGTEPAFQAYLQRRKEYSTYTLSALWDAITDRCKKFGEPSPEAIHIAKFLDGDRGPENWYWNAGESSPHRTYDNAGRPFRPFEHRSVEKRGCIVRNVSPLTDPVDLQGKRVPAIRA